LVTGAIVDGIADRGMLHLEGHGDLNKQVPLGDKQVSAVDYSYMIAAKNITVKYGLDQMSDAERLSFLSKPENRLMAEALATDSANLALQRRYYMNLAQDQIKSKSKQDTLSKVSGTKSSQKPVDNGYGGTSGSDE
jgi:hypothetical protein